MKHIDFPVLGVRPATEFVVGGVLEPEPAELGDTAPGAWVFDRNSVPMQRQEWWYHTGTQLWFLVDRDTGSDEILAIKLARDG
jgi:sarcosine oxidase subunit delta